MARNDVLLFGACSGCSRAPEPFSQGNVQVMVGGVYRLSTRVMTSARWDVLLLGTCEAAHNPGSMSTQAGAGLSKHNTLTQMLGLTCCRHVGLLCAGPPTADVLLAAAEAHTLSEAAVPQPAVKPLTWLPPRGDGGGCRLPASVDQEMGTVLAQVNINMMQIPVVCQYAPGGTVLAPRQRIPLTWCISSQHALNSLLAARCYRLNVQLTSTIAESTCSMLLLMAHHSRRCCRGAMLTAQENASTAVRRSPAASVVLAGILSDTLVSGW